MTASTGPRPIPHLREPPLVGSLFAFQKERLELLNRINTECGEIGAFNMGPVTIVIPNSAELIESVMVKEAARMGRGPFYQLLVPLVGPNSLLTLEGEKHRRFRRLHTPLFQHKRLVSYVEPMVEFADEFQRGIRDGQEVDMEQAMMRLAQRVIERTLFSDRSGEADPQALFEALAEASRYFVYRLTNLIAPPLSWPTERNRRMRNAVAVLRSRSQGLIDTWRAEGAVDRGDLLSMLMLSRDEDGSSLQNEEIIDNVLTLYNAGHETTAVAFMWILYYVSLNPEVEAKLHQEVDTVLNGRKPEYADLARLPYTLQVVKEGLRLGSPPWVFGRAPLEDIEVQGYKLRKGQFIMLSPYTLHRNPKYYPNPERFDPERFSPENEKKLSRYAFLPFSMGPMVCIGQQFAMMELHSMVAHLAQHLRFKVAPGEEVKPVPLITLRPSSLRMVVERRSASSGQQPGGDLKKLA